MNLKEIAKFTRRS